MRSPINLLEETIIELKRLGHTPAEVLWVGSKNGEYAMSWDKFTKIADFIYDCGYTWGNSINEDLVVVGADWWLSRKVGIEGVEMWELQWTPQQKESARPFNSVKSKESWWEASVSAGSNE